jgi:hypothetical protein
VSFASFLTTSLRRSLRGRVGAFCSGADGSWREGHNLPHKVHLGFAFGWPNISAVVKREQRILDDRTTVERIGDAVGSFAGSMSFLALHVVVFRLWFLVNARVVYGIAAFDPFPFVHLSMAVSFEAVLLSTFVLMKQKCPPVLQLICAQLGIESVGRDRDTEILSQDTLVDKLADELPSRLPPE